MAATTSCSVMPSRTAPRLRPGTIVVAPACVLRADDGPGTAEPDGPPAGFPGVPAPPPAGGGPPPDGGLSPAGRSTPFGIATMTPLPSSAAVTSKWTAKGHSTTTRTTVGAN